MEEIEILNEQHDDLLGKVPRNILIWSSIILLFFSLSLFLGLSFTSFPTKQSGNITFISTDSKPIIIRSTQPLVLTKLLVKDSSSVTSGQRIAYGIPDINNSDVLAMDNLIEKVLGGNLDASMLLEVKHLNFIGLKKEYRELLSLLRQKSRQQDVKGYVAIFKNKFDDWKKGFFLTAENTGRIYFNEVEMLNNQFEIGTPIYTLISTSKKKIYAQMLVDSKKATDIINGQLVNIQISDLKEFNDNIMQGNVLKSILDPGVDGKFKKTRIIISCPKELESYVRKKYVNLESLSASGEIYSHDQTLLQRLKKSILKKRG
ncbi:hypothetical protein [Pedobacter xixiisoli]|uniref:HlyD family secretion protein n=1 Tax=Pedobacter xixiisoli TaxID=1476464 RepID=A0A285ZS00_9SPHI|nr:hypothetical protein [Pedobacter xixiisoli]SOD12433.1 hypothetical protein SAMN06297358_0666 [Pedobacter xixiisoli]